MDLFSLGPGSALVLAFSWMKYDFMRHAFLAILMICPALSLLGTMVVTNRMAFFSDALGHATLTGVALGVLAGLKDPLLGMLAFSLLLAVAIIWSGEKGGSSEDTVIGVFCSAAVALGVVILSKGGGFYRYSRYLVGDILAITPQQLASLAALMLMVLLVWLLFFNPLFLTWFNGSVAATRGIRTFWVKTWFAALLALTITFSIQWLGILVINALLVLPSAAARNVASTMSSFHLLAVAIGLVGGIIGLISSYYMDTATGATVVVICFLVYLFTLALRWLKN